MRRSIYIALFFLVLSGCATVLRAPARYQEVDNSVQLCIENRSGGPVILYEVHGRARLASVYRGRECVKLPQRISEADGATGLCVTTLSVDWCVPLPWTHYSSAPVWALSLNQTNNWSRDVWGLAPAPAVQQ